MEQDEVLKTFLGGEPINIQCSNGAIVHVTVNVIPRDMQPGSLQRLAEMIDNAPAITREVIVKAG